MAEIILGTDWDSETKRKYIADAACCRTQEIERRAQKSRGDSEKLGKGGKIK